MTANLTNEGGVEHTYRILKNVMGLWLLQGLQKELSNPEFCGSDLAGGRRAGIPVSDQSDDERFLNPPSMQKIQAYCRRNPTGLPYSASELARCILDSLALYYRVVIDELEELPVVG